MKKKNTLISTLVLVAASISSLNASPNYSKRKEIKQRSMKQSPTVIVSDSYTERHAVVKGNVKLQQIATSQQPVVQKVKTLPSIDSKVATNEVAPQSIEIPASVYVPTAKQLRKTKKAKRKKGNQGKEKSAVTAVLLNWFVGLLGIHRFYLGYTGIGIIQLLTLGFFGIWTLIDLILLIMGELQPKNGEYKATLKEELDNIF